MFPKDKFGFLFFNFDQYCCRVGNLEGKKKRKRKRFKGLYCNFPNARFFLGGSENVKNPKLNV